MATYAGIAFRTEGTGGGCTVHAAQVEGGVIVLSDGNGGTDYAAMAEHGLTVFAGFFPGTSWTDEREQREASHEAEGETPDAAVAALIAKVAGK